MAKGVLITRPQPAADLFAATLPAVWTPIIAPLTQIIGEQIALPACDAVLFTSQNAVRFAPDGTGRVAFCVGDKTATQARARGYQAHSANGAVDNLLAMIAGDTAQTLIHIRGADTTGDLATRLRAIGRDVSEVIAYRAQPVPLSNATQIALKNGDVEVITIFSPRAAALLAQAADGWPFAQMDAVVISAAAAEPLKSVLFRQIHIAKQPTAASLRAALGSYEVSPLEGDEPIA